MIDDANALLVRAADATVVATPEELAALHDFAESDVSEGTRKVYARAVKRFERWAAERTQGPALPTSAPVLALYVTTLGTRGVGYSAISVDVAALARWHHERGFESPSDDPRVRRVLQGIGNKLGRAAEGAKPVSLGQLRALAGAVPLGANGLRARAMILLGFYAALRRSEVCALHREDVAAHELGLLVTLRRSKSDQGGRGRTKAVPRVPDELCPERALRAWLAVRGEQTGPLFGAIKGRAKGRCPSGSTFSLIFKLVARRAKLADEGLSTHGLRSGWATEVANRGGRVERIQAHLGHASPEMALRYVRAREAWIDHPGALLF